MSSQTVPSGLSNWDNPGDFIELLNYGTFQDLAIAAYLVSLWSSEATKPKSFIDIGCGNGLLVYLLTQEGFEGGVGLVSSATILPSLLLLHECLNRAPISLYVVALVLDLNLHVEQHDIFAISQNHLSFFSWQMLPSNVVLISYGA